MKIKDGTLISNSQTQLIDYSKDELDSKLQQLDMKKDHIMSMLKETHNQISFNNSNSSLKYSNLNE